MKILICALLSVGFLAAADHAAKIPAAAVKSEDGSYRYTDSQGRKWIFRQTPWGVAKAEDAPARPEAVSPTRLYPGLKATEAGEFVRFERPGPFGTYRWQTRKSELNEMERAAWEGSQAAQQN